MRRGVPFGPRTSIANARLPQKTAGPEGTLTRNRKRTSAMETSRAADAVTAGSGLLKPSQSSDYTRPSERAANAPKIFG